MKLITKLLPFMMLAMLAGKANAVVVNYNGADYDLTTVTGTYSSLENTLVDQAWWGDSVLSESLAGLLMFDLGPYYSSNGQLPVSVAPYDPLVSPLFAFEFVSDQESDYFSAAYYYEIQNIGNGTLSNGFDLLDPQLGGEIEYTFVVASTEDGGNSTEVPEPGSLAIFGLGLLGLGMRFRKKIIG